MNPEETKKGCPSSSQQLITAVVVIIIVIDEKMVASVMPDKVLSFSPVHRKASLEWVDRDGKLYMDFIWFMKWLVMATLLS